MLLSNVLEVVDRLSSTAQIKIFLHVADKGVVNTVDVIKDTKLTTKAFEKAVVALSRFRGAANVACGVDSQGQRWLMASATLYGTKIERCAHCRKITKAAGGYCLTKCRLSESFNLSLAVKNTRKIVTVRDGDKQEIKPSDSMAELVKHLRHRYSNAFYGAKIQFGVMPLKQYVKKLRDFFAVFTGKNNCDEDVKKYITTFIASLDNETQFSVSRMVDYNAINRYVSANKLLAKAASREYCDVRDVRCAYRHGGVCDMEAGGVACDDKFFKSMTSGDVKK